ncbi:MAG: CDP-alcohol phosphatidyltransferase family protein [Verrucomicrobia bacterium]|nr:CDP-alcohol phosphatidyltransferase family protein [Verrucomicrobiota bacterium]
MKRMFTLSNILTLLRAPLALFFLMDSIPIRLSALILAMFTDCIDGYIARRNQTASQFGAILDPLMDKFFVFFTLSILFSEGKIELWQACSMIARDFFLCLFAIYLSFFHLWDNYKYKSIPWGKVSTSLQFIILIGLTAGYTFHNFVFAIFILTGSLAFIQLLKLRASQES